MYDLVGKVHGGDEVGRAMDTPVCAPSAVLCPFSLRGLRFLQAEQHQLRKTFPYSCSIYAVSIKALPVRLHYSTVLYIRTLVILNEKRVWLHNLAWLYLFRLLDVKPSAQM